MSTCGFTRCILSWVLCKYRYHQKSSSHHTNLNHNRTGVPKTHSVIAHGLHKGIMPKRHARPRMLDIIRYTYKLNYKYACQYARVTAPITCIGHTVLQLLLLEVLIHTSEMFSPGSSAAQESWTGIGSRLHRAQLQFEAACGRQLVGWL